MARRWTPEVAKSRWAALQDQEIVARLKGERKAMTVEVRRVPYHPSDHLPTPYSREMSGRAREPARLASGAELGLDAEGRTTFVRYPVPGRFKQMFFWSSGGCEVVSPGSASTSVSYFNFEGDRLVEEIEVHGPPPGVHVRRWSYDADGRPVLAVETYELGSGSHWGGKLYRLSYDQEGTLAQIQVAFSREDFASGGDVEEAQAVALAGASTLFEAPYGRPLYESAPVEAERQRREQEALRLEALHEGEPPSAEALIRDHAVAGFRLIAPEEATSRPAAIIGGPGLLPRGVDWPRSDEGRALAFLAAIDFGALPPTPDDAPDLPSAGWLLCFADIDDPTGEEEGQWYGRRTPNTPGAGAQSLWVSPGQEPVAVTGPGIRGRNPAPEQRRITKPHPTLPDGTGAGKAIGLTTNHARVYDDVARELRYGTAELEPSNHHAWLPDDWILGAVTGVQGNSPDDNSLLLLHLASVAFQDGGAIQVRISAEALAAQDWTQAYMVADSG